MYRIRYALNARLSALSEDTLVNLSPLCKRGIAQTHHKNDVIAVARVRIRSKHAHRWSAQMESAFNTGTEQEIDIDADSFWFNMRERERERERETGCPLRRTVSTSALYDLIKFNMTRPLATDRIRDHTETSTTPERRRACSYTA